MLPSPMMPQILLGRAADPALERGGVIGDDAVDVRLAVARVGDVDRLEAKPVLPRWRPERGAEDDRRAEAKREDRRPARRLGVAPEERHPRGCEPDRALIDEKR